MRQKDIRPGEYYAYRDPYWPTTQYAKVYVIDPPKGGEVLVDILHPSRDVEDDRSSVRVNHVQPWDDVIATEQAEVWKSIREQRLIAEALSYIGIKRAGKDYLGKGGGPLGVETDVRYFERREIVKLVKLAEKGKNPPRPVLQPWAFLLADLTGPWSPGEDITIGGLYPTEEQATQRVADLADHGTKVRTLRVIGG